MALPVITARLSLVHETTLAKNHVAIAIAAAGGPEA